MTKNKRRAQRRRAKQKKNLLWAGLAGIVILLLAVALWPRSDTTLALEISVEEAYQKYQEDIFFLDVREQEEWDEYHAPNSALIPLGQLAGRVDELPQDQEIVVICRSGNRSQQGRDILTAAGFTQVTSMAGGLTAWRDLGFPVESGTP